MLGQEADGGDDFSSGKGNKGSKVVTGSSCGWKAV